jgi:inner membrane protein
MDTISQAALGACVGQAAFSNKLGSGKAITVGLICGLIPDLDFLLSIGKGRFEYLATHRGWSHSIFFLAVLAFPIAWMAMRWALSRDRAKGRVSEKYTGHYFTWYGLCSLALITHPLLDLFTSYGTQLFIPFSNGRYTLNAVAIVDPLYTIPLVVAAGLALRFPSKKDRHVLWAGVALAVSCGYLVLGMVHSKEARIAGIAQFASQNYQVVDVQASPTIFNNLLWRIVAKGADGRYAVGLYSAVTKKTIDFHFLEGGQGPLVTKALKTEEGKIMEWFTTGMFRARVESETGQTVKVFLTDMRLGIASNVALSPFEAVFEYDRDSQIRRIYMSRENFRTLDPLAELKTIWSGIWR